MIIGLLYGHTKFRSLSIKPYFKDDQQPVPDSFAPIQVPQAEAARTKIAFIETPQTDATPADIPTIEPVAKPPLALLALLDPVKRGGGRLKKYPEQANIAAPSDICFLIDKFNMFINKNVDVQPAQYTASRQKEVTKLLEKEVFKAITSEDVPSNARIFNSCFVDKIKNPDIDKTYEKRRLVVQVYND